MVADKRRRVDDDKSQSTLSIFIRRSVPEAQATQIQQDNSVDMDVEVASLSGRARSLSETKSNDGERKKVGRKEKSDLQLWKGWLTSDVNRDSCLSLHVVDEEPFGVFCQVCVKVKVVGRLCLKKDLTSIDYYNGRKLSYLIDHLSLKSHESSVAKVKQLSSNKKVLEEAEMSLMQRNEVLFYNHFLWVCKMLVTNTSLVSF